VYSYAKHKRLGQDDTALPGSFKQPTPPQRLRLLQIDFQHLALQNHIGASQSNDVTRIFPPSSRLNASVVLSVVPRRSSVFPRCAAVGVTLWVINCDFFFRVQNVAMRICVRIIRAGPGHVGLANRVGPLIDVADIDLGEVSR
jgi:hypothetical protein